MTKSNRRFQWLTALYATIGLAIYWWRIIIDSHLYLFGKNQEGIRNYFSPLYYILFDRDFRFTGMSYPYGEHLAYVDAQPGLSMIFAPLLNGNTEYAGNIIAIMNLLMLVSIPLGAVYLFRIFTLWKMPNFYSAIVAACIALLSPQVYRMTGQYALSYVCFFPMIWFYAAYWLQSGKITSLIFLFITITAFGFLHTTYFSLSTVFLILSAFIFLLYKRKKKGGFIKAISLSGVTLLPIACYVIWLKFTGALDMADRHPHPYDLFQGLSSFTSVFVPSEGPVKQILNLFLPLGQVEWEGKAYVGTAAILCCITGLWVLRDRIQEKEFLAPSLGVFLLAAIFCLMLSFSVPLNLLPQHWLPDYLWKAGSFGRFAWAFYYVFAGTGAWLLYILTEYLRKKSHAVIAMTLTVMAILLWGIEALSVQKGLAKEIMERGQLAGDFLSIEDNYNEWLGKIGKSSSQFQAILAFPFFNAGNEELYINRSTSSLYYACKASLALQLPLIQNYQGKASLEQSIKAIQLLSNPLIEKLLLKDLKDDRSILLVAKGNAFHEDEQRILAGSTFLIREKDVALYDVPLSVFRQQLPERKAFGLNNPKFRYLVQGDTIVSLSRESTVWKNPGDSQKLVNDILWEGPWQPGENDLLEVSVWLDILTGKAAFPILYVDIINERGELIQQYFTDPRITTDVMPGQVRARVLVPGHRDTKQIRVRLEGEEQSVGPLLIRPSSATVWVRTRDGKEYWNNYPL